MKNILQSISDARLEEELARRKAKAAKVDARPQPVKEPDLSKLITMTQDYLKGLAENGFTDDDSKHYIYEEAMMALYGRDVFKWINEQDR